MKLSGKALKYGNDVNTDLIIAGKYTKTLDMTILAEHAMEDIDANFHERLKEGDFVVGGENFGCGSSREQAPLALKNAGVGCVVASSFGRIFFRNAINIGLPIVECDTSAISDGDKLRYDAESGTLTNITKETTVKVEPMPQIMIEILNEGGLVNFLKIRKDFGNSI